MYTSCLWRQGANTIRRGVDTTRHVEVEKDEIRSKYPDWAESFISGLTSLNLLLGPRSSTKAIAMSEHTAWGRQGFHFLPVLQSQVDEVANETLEQKVYVLKDSLEMLFWDFLMT